MSDPLEPAPIRSRLSSPLSLLLLVVAAVSGATAVFLPVNQLTQPDATATVNIGSAASQSALNGVPEVPENVQLTPTSDDGLTVTMVAGPKAGETSVPWTLRLLSDLGTSVWAAAVAIVAYLLARILANISAGDPFHHQNARRFIWIAIAIVAGSLVADSVNLFNARALTDYAGIGAPIEVMGYFSFTPLVVAGVCAVIATAFRQGRAMADDVAGLV